ncbi:MAG: NYN domain-containing protein [Ignavibacteria bacterium]|nr:NYN domain-containing protein [Ignavibacteria bacterium]
MKHYVIDGNNLIGKLPSLKTLQKKDKQGSREKLAFMINNYFNQKNAKVFLHFDGHPKESITINNASIVYSKNLTADEMIKSQVGKSKNPRNIIVITSDNNLTEYARVCSCSVIMCEEFSKDILHQKDSDEEKMRIEEINNNEEFKKLFGI